MLSGVFDLFANVLALLYSWVNSYGFAITALTVVVMMVTTPLTYKGHQVHAADAAPAAATQGHTSAP
jgi:membrane protein insertase Oxa1/YidC/SpoIIIJ